MAVLGGQPTTSSGVTGSGAAAPDRSVTPASARSGGTGRISSPSPAAHRSPMRARRGPAASIVRRRLGPARSGGPACLAWTSNRNGQCTDPRDDRGGLAGIVGGQSGVAIAVMRHIRRAQSDRQVHRRCYAICTSGPVRWTRDWHPGLAKPRSVMCTVKVSLRTSRPWTWRWRVVEHQEVPRKRPA